MKSLSEKDKALFETKPIYLSVLILALPTVISQLISVAYNLADTYFISKTNDTVQVAAVTMVLPLFLMLTVFSNLFGVGSSSLISRFLGKGDYDSVKKVSSFAVWITVICALAYSVLLYFFREPILRLFGAEEGDMLAYSVDYVFWTIVVGGLPSILNVVLAHLIRATGKSLQASIGMAIGAILNIILDPIFILPSCLGMQCKGAAIATCISNFVATLYFLLYLLTTRKKTVLSLHPKYFTLQPKLAGKAIVIGLPNAAMTFTATFSNIVLNLLLSANGSAAVAALGIIKKVDLIPAHIAQGISQGILPLLSYNHSIKNKERVKKTIVFSLGITVCIAAVFLVTYELFATDIMQLFIRQSETVTIGTTYIRLHCMAMPLLSVLFVFISIFQAKEKSNRALILTLVRKGTVDIPLMYLLNYVWPVYGIILAQPIMDFVALMLALLFYFVIPCKGNKVSEL